MSNRALLIIHLVVFAVMCALAFLTNGLGGGGDSLTHYFISKLAWQQPSYFLDLWGKPVFTTVSSPFSQFGFMGVKIFNVACGVAASYFSCLVARLLSKDWHWAILPIAFLAPAFYTYLFSGLTEPLAALLGISSVWLCLTGRVSIGFIAASFLPFARSEAQVFLIFFLIFGLLNGHFKKLPLLLSAHVLYAILSFFVFGDLFHAFDSPYDSQGSVYGSGGWLHYIGSLKNMLAWPGFTLMGLGFIQFFRKWFILKNINWRTEPWLVHGLFLSLLAGHTLVWALGIYGSAGLERTLLTAFPFLWIIMLDGLLLLRDISLRIHKKAGVALPIGLLALQLYLTAFSPVARYYRSLHLTPGAEYNFFSQKVVPFIEAEYPQASQFVMDKPEMAVALGKNFMNEDDRLNWGFYHRPQAVSDKTLWIFDSYYVPVQYGIPLEKIRNEGKLKEIKSFRGPEGWTYIIFEKAQ